MVSDALSHNVIGEIKGSENPDNIILVGGHLDSWDVSEGAHDDGAGCVHSIGALRLFQKQGIKPKNTLRAVMFMNEENGLSGRTQYAENAIKNNEKHIVAIESDANIYPKRFWVFWFRRTVGKNTKLVKVILTKIQFLIFQRWGWCRYWTPS